MRPGLRSILVLLGIVSPLLYCSGVMTQTGDLGKFATSLCAELITPKGYNCTEHKAVTEDGFILGIQNIPSGGAPVLLMHGLIAGGDNFCANSAMYSLAFVLADAGFDVYIGNNRAIQWSHGHLTFTPSQEAYWAWTYDELASYDLKALTEFVYTFRNKTKLTYIGHSQGGLMLLAGLSTGGKFKTEVLGYLNAAVLLAPATDVGHLTAPIVKVGFTILADEALTLVGNGEFNANLFVNLSCTSPLINPLLCANVYTGVLGQNSYVNTALLKFYAQYFPQPTSSFNINHYGQSFRTDTFQFYDKGLLGNEAAYKQLTPPPHDLTTFPASLPLQVWTGGIDGLVDPTDAAAALAKLPSSNRQVITLPDYGHVDFTYGLRAYLDVYPRIITFVKSQNS